MSQHASPLPPIVVDLIRSGKTVGAHVFDWSARDYLRVMAGSGPCDLRFAWDDDVRADLARLERDRPDPDAEVRLGEGLRAFLLQAGWGEDEARVLGALREKGTIHIVFRFAAAELFALPWELMPLGEKGRRLGTIDGVDIRYECPGPLTTPLDGHAPEGGRVLFAYAAPRGEVPYEGQRRAIDDALRSAGLGTLTADDVLEDASRESLASKLRAAQAQGRPFTLLHLLAHGEFLEEEREDVGLLLDDGVVHPVYFAELLAPHAATLRTVVLAACGSGDSGRITHHVGSVAQCLHRYGIESVVASRHLLTTDGSVQLSKTLYSSLLSGSPPRSLEAALAEARTALREGAYAPDGTGLQRYGRSADGLDTRPFVFRPYRGLLAFGPEHRRLFFGRTEECREILDELRALVDGARPRFQIVEGASGSGKSSVLLAGVVPQLEAEGWAWVRLVPGRSPTAALAEGLTRLGTGGTHQLLLVDQAEEIFTQGADPGERSAFFQQLWELATQPGGRISVLCAMRTDFRGLCGEVLLEPSSADGRRLDGLFTSGERQHQVFIPHPTRSALRLMIEGPATAVGLVLQDGLVERLLADVGTEPGALPLLEYALDRVWERRSGRVLTQEAYDAIGGISGAIRERAEALFDGLDETSRREARRLLVRLVAVGETGVLPSRRRVPLDELRPSDPAAAHAFDAILERMVRERLLVHGHGVADRDAATVEVAHEALIRGWPRLHAWVNEDRHRLTELEQLESWADRWARSQGAILTPDEVAYARRIRDAGRGELSERAHGLIAASEAAIEAHARAVRAREEEERRAAARERAQARWAGIGVFVLVATGFLAIVIGFAAVVAWSARDLAKTHAADLRTVLDERGKASPEEKVELLAETRLPLDLPEWLVDANALAQAGGGVRFAEGLETTPSSARISPDGRWVLLETPLRSGLWDVYGGRRLSLPCRPRGWWTGSVDPAFFCFTEDGTATGTGEVWLYDTRGSRLRRLAEDAGPLGGPTPNGKLLVTWSAGGTSLAVSDVSAGSEVRRVEVGATLPPSAGWWLRDLLVLPMIDRLIVVDPEDGTIGAVDVGGRTIDDVAPHEADGAILRAGSSLLRVEHVSTRLPMPPAEPSSGEQHLVDASRDLEAWRGADGAVRLRSASGLVHGLSLPSLALLAGFSADGRGLLAGPDSRHPVAWSVPSSLPGSWARWEGQPANLLFPDGKILVTSTTAGFAPARLGVYRSGGVVRSWRLPDAVVGGEYALAPDGAVCRRGRVIASAEGAEVSEPSSAARTDCPRWSATVAAQDAGDPRPDAVDSNTNGSVRAYLTRDFAVHVEKVQDDTELAVFPAVPGELGLALAPAGGGLVTWGATEVYHWWSLTGTLLGTLDARPWWCLSAVLCSGRPTVAAFDPTGRSAIVNGAEHLVRWWPTPAAGESAEVAIGLPPEVRAPAGLGVHPVLFSPTDDTIATYKVPASGAPYVELPGPDGDPTHPIRLNLPADTVTAELLSATTLETLQADGTVRRWEFNPQKLIEAFYEHSWLCPRDPGTPPPDLVGGWEAIDVVPCVH